MHHAFIDQYSGLESVLHDLDPRTKSLFVLAFICTVLFTPPTAFLSFGLYLGLIAFLILLSKIPFSFVLKRSLVVIPFVLAIAIFIPFFKKGTVAGAYSFGTVRLTVTHEGLTILWNVLAKSYLSALSLILLSSSTRFSDLLHGLEKMKAPRILLMILSFMYRYIYVVADELMRMKRAMDSRTVRSRKLPRIKALSSMLGVLFVRAYERGERVYLAMCARGFDGDIRTLSSQRMRASDISFLFAGIAALVIIRLAAT